MRASNALRPVMAVAVLLAAAPLLAQQPPADPVARFNHASDLAEQGKLDEAIAIWLEVANAIPENYRPALQLNLGLAYKLLDRPAEAWHHLTVHQAAVDEDGRKASTPHLKEVEKKLAADGYVRVEISCRPPTASLYFADSAAGPAYPCPLTWWFAPGPRTVYATAADHEPALARFDVVKGVPVPPLNLTLQPQYGTIEITGTPAGAQVFIDGELQGVLPCKRKVTAGTHAVMVARSGGPSWETTVQVAANANVVAEASLQAEPPPPPPPPPPDTPPPISPGLAAAQPEPTGNQVYIWSLVGGGAALIAAGGILNWMAADRNEELKEQWPDGTPAAPVPAANQTSYDAAFDDEVQPRLTASWALYGTGAAAFAAGIVWWLLDDSAAAPADDGPVPLSPLLLPEGLGVSVNVMY